MSWARQPSLSECLGPSIIWVAPFSVLIRVPISKRGGISAIACLAAAMARFSVSFGSRTTIGSNFDRLAFMADLALADPSRVRPLPFWSLLGFFITSLLKCSLSVLFGTHGGHTPGHTGDTRGAHRGTYTHPAYPLGCMYRVYIHSLG